MVKPDAKSSMVFNNGSSNALMDSIPLGGHCEPISEAGESELWKKVQKIARKNKPSLTINKATPIFKPLCTANV